MYCPTCGTATGSNQRYCRTCGVGLTVDGHTPFNMQAWGLVALILIFGGLLVSMGGKLADMKWLIFTGLLIMFSGIFGIAAFALIRQTRPRRRESVPISEMPVTLRADTTNKLPPLDPSDFIPSVVDETTELLNTPAARSDRRAEQ